ncbi:transcriptional regulator, ArsR family [Beutenbergia cavernae DSM 12333]|uniref:Transcriptional regulator, ArsR family n=1 Tax=Beutenbergia cavernae (strain ATCC BAA-8 / DSM 12333 / CCUG 43141 / JCM 11478 / NBRC 16432 / NCIMB 13614 / HKI 0122) TaxID=471853 RepID=C5C529_BEUC1|nr:metalloregulator ArsR/SmtB family transcription factor [Beutenbergia cavernae]ACQ82169.1 transcriptional regulator, ArsR family [Beutenbergia cavernae DSM 12333]
MLATDPWTALADPTRRGILARVLARPTSVTDLARDVPVSRPAVSQHLQVLLEARLVEVRPQGRQRIYSARLDGLADLRHELEQFWTQALATFKQVAESTYASQEETP